MISKLLSYLALLGDWHLLISHMSVMLFKISSVHCLHFAIKFQLLDGMKTDTSGSIWRHFSVFLVTDIDHKLLVHK